MSILQHETSVDVLRAQVAAHADVRGYKAQLAAAAGCQRSFLSQVLAGRHQLSLEHGLGLAACWSLGPVERDYFLDLIGRDRAGTPALRAFYDRRLGEHRDRAQNLAKRFQVTELPVESLETYYATWIPAAVHMLLTVPKFQTAAAIARRLRLPSDLIDETLASLVQAGLARKQGAKHLATSPILHLPQGSPLNQVNHGNWRQLATQRAARSGGTHYTAVYSLSATDARRLQEMTLGWIEASRRLVAPSPEEDVIALLIDFFPV